MTAASRGFRIRKYCDEVKTLYYNYGGTLRYKANDTSEISLYVSKLSMAIFEHKNYADPKMTYDNPHKPECLYCFSKLKFVDIDDIWGESDDNEVLKVQKTVHADYKEFHGLEDCYLNLRMETKDEEIRLDYCPICGWWRVVKDVCVCAEQWQIWDIFFGLSGKLKTLDLTDINQPIAEVKNFLIAKYDSRFFVNPRLFEEAVASVFKGIGYDVNVTGYSNDGGIDVVLEKDQNSKIGVQVKRYKNKIKVEQIRAFAGALILSNFAKGIFVTTSDFQPGAVKASEIFTRKTLPIELINARKFYDALKISQKPFVDIDSIKDSLKNNSKNLFEYGWVTPRNSL